MMPFSLNIHIPFHHAPFHHASFLCHDRVYDARVLFALQEVERSVVQEDECRWQRFQSVGPIPSTATAGAVLDGPVPPHTVFLWKAHIYRHHIAH